MKSAKKLVSVTALLALGLAVMFYEPPLMPLGLCGFSAKLACTAHFLSHRPLSHIYSHELRFTIASLFTQSVADESARTITTTLWPIPFYSRTAVYLGPSCGCVLTAAFPFNGSALSSYSEYCAQQTTHKSPQPLSADNGWPFFGDRDPAQNAKELGLDVQAIESWISAEFLTDEDIKPTSLGGKGIVDERRTRAVLVIYKGKLIAERYGFGADWRTPLMGWSMTKALTSTLIGIFYGNKYGLKGVEHLEQKMKSETSLFPEWTKKKDDERAQISLDDLLRMTSYLEWTEDYTGDSDVTRMLLIGGDASGYAMTCCSRFKNESLKEWMYQSGNTNLLMRKLRDEIGSDEEYWSFPRKALFDRILAKSAVMEVDESGTFVGSSFSYMIARDWARYGLLYLWNGSFPHPDEGNDRQILPEGWVEYTRKSALGSKGKYGAGFWRHGGPEDRKAGDEWLQDVPDDIFYAHGFEEQTVAMIPSKDLVVVRLGVTQGGKYSWDKRKFWRGLMRVLE